MSFTDSNRNFLKFGFEVPLRGFSEADRVLKYQENIRKEARRRFKLFYLTIENDLSKKILFYKELLNHFGPLEQRYLLYSIFFDSQSDDLIVNLKATIAQILDLKAEPLKLLFENTIPPYEDSITKGFLKDFFFGTLHLSINEWKEEDDKRNPIINKLTAWLIHAISSVDTKESKVEEVTLNYTKLWNVYFAHPFNIPKALILIHKIFDQYKAFNPQLVKINLNCSLTDINLFLSEILPEPQNSPLTDFGNISVLNSRGLNNLNFKTQENLINKRLEFEAILLEDSIYFQDLSMYPWPKLLLKSCTATDRNRKAYINEINRRCYIGNLPTYIQLNEFLNQVDDDKIKQQIDKKTLDKIKKDHYLFFT